MNSSNLLSIGVGDHAVIDSVTACDPMRRRLLDLGMTPGSHIECVYEAPSGNPKAYLIRGAIIALRNHDAQTVFLSGKA